MEKQMNNDMETWIKGRIGDVGTIGRILGFILGLFGEK